MKKVFPFILILCAVGAWMSIAYRNISVPEEYKTILAGAYDACEQGYYLEAQKLLNEAKEFQEGSSYEIAELQRDIYYGLQSGSAYESQLQSMINAYPEKEENYELLIDYYRSVNDTKELCRCLPEYLELWPANEMMKAAGEELDKQHEYIMTGYYDVKYASASLADVQEKEYEIVQEEEIVSRKLVNSRGSTIFDAGYAQMSVAQDGSSCFVCDQDGNWTRVDVSQNLLARNGEVHFDYVGRLSANNIATAVIDEKYHFINEKMKVSGAEWEEAGTFCDGVNAVKKNGKWALVTTQTWGEVTEFPYTDIPRNSQDCCVAEGYGVVADERGYYIISAEDFQPVSENVFEEMKAFECSQPTAYRKGDKWGFVNKQGQVYIEACYEDAKPFYNGYAAVKENGLWGYIDRNGTMVIEPQFLDALNVMESGYAYVQNEFGYWDYIIISKLYYAD